MNSVIRKHCMKLYVEHYFLNDFFNAMNKETWGWWKQSSSVCFQREPGKYLQNFLKRGWGQHDFRNCLSPRAHMMQADILALNLIFRSAIHLLLISLKNLTIYIICFAVKTSSTIWTYYTVLAWFWKKTINTCIPIWINKTTFPPIKEHTHS